LRVWYGKGILHDKSIITVCKDKYNCIINKCTNNRYGNETYGCDYFEFTREDILLTYFKLEKSKRYSFQGRQKFVDCDEYKKAHVTISRTLKTLCENDYIGLYGKAGYSTIIRLTDKGIAKAAELLGTNSPVIS